MESHQDLYKNFYEKQDTKIEYVFFVSNYLIVYLF